MITFDRLIPMSYFEIFAPKYSTDEVLLKATKVKEHNKIVFTKAKSLAGKVFYVSGKDVKKCPKSYNGSIAVYCVPMDKLEELELIETGEFAW